MKKENELTVICANCFKSQLILNTLSYVCANCQTQQYPQDKLAFCCPRCGCLLGATTTQFKVQCPQCHYFIEIKTLKQNNRFFILKKFASKRKSFQTVRVNPYLLFSNEMKKEKSALISSIGMAEFAKRLGRQWKENKEIREFYEKKAKEHRRRNSM